MSIENIINEAWEKKDQINKDSDKSIIEAIKETIHLLNEGKITVVEPQGNDWKINEWIQKGILLSFRVNDKKIIGGPYNAWNDFEHLPGKTAGWTEKDFEKAIEKHKEFLLNQWIKRIEEFLPEARIGIIQASKVDYKNKDIVIGMLQSLSSKEYDIEEVFGDFGFTVVDECHHIAAEVFSRSLPKVILIIHLDSQPHRKEQMDYLMYLKLI